MDGRMERQGNNVDDRRLAEKLAGLGNSGRHRGNVHRDLRVVIRRLEPNLPQPYEFEAPSCNGQPRLISIYLPHEVLSNFSNAEVASDTACDLWVDKLRDEWATRVDAIGSAALPLKLHGDGVKVTRRRSVTVLSITLLTKNNQGRRFVLAIVDGGSCCDCGCGGFHTYQAIFEVLVWSLQISLSRQWPSCRHDGSAWSAESDQERTEHPSRPPVLAALLLLTGDWAWFSALFHIRCWSSKQICWRCDAGREGEEAPWTDVSRDAVWRQRRLEHADFIQRAVSAGHDVPSAFSFPGFRLSMVGVDVLHCMDLGVTQDILGSFLWEWVNALGAVWSKRRLILLNQLLRRFYKSVTKKVPQVDVITKEMLKQKKSCPRLTQCKGAETRHLVPFVLELADKIATQKQTVFWTRRRACLEALNDFYNSIQVPADAYVPDHTSNSLFAVATTFMLIHRSITPGKFKRPPWHPRPKLHMAQELGDQCHEAGNPRLWWCYADESYMGIVKKVAFKISHPTNMERNCLERLTLQGTLSRL